jgi:hypothetical protein
MLDQRGHEAGGFVYDCVFASLPEFERVTTPTTVSYTIDPGQFVSDPDAGLALSYDGAYWISGMAVADDSTVGRIRALRNDLIAEDPPTDAEHVDRRGDSGPDGGDLCDPDADVHTDDTWRERAVERTPIGAEATEPSVSLLMTNLAAVTVDLSGDGFVEGGHFGIESDGDTEITFTGLEPGTVLAVGDEEVEAGDDGTLTFSVDPGDTTATIG